MVFILTVLCRPNIIILIKYYKTENYLFANLCNWLLHHHGNCSLTLMPVGHVINIRLVCKLGTSLVFFLRQSLGEASWQLIYKQQLNVISKATYNSNCSGTKQKTHLPNIFLKISMIWHPKCESPISIMISLYTSSVLVGGKGAICPWCRILHTPETPCRQCVMSQAVFDLSGKRSCQSAE